MGHLGYQNLVKLVQRGKATGINIPKKQLSDFPVCDECRRANQQRSSFKNTHTEHATQVKGLVFTDLKGPIETNSIEGNRFVQSFVDDWSGYITAYLLSYKSEALDRFKEYVARAENKHRTKINAVNSDNEGEFQSPAWINFCNSTGIERRTSSAYTPEQNGSAEVRFRVLFRKDRSMLIAAQLPKQFWGEALYAAVIVANASPLHRAEETPYERWHDIAPD
ncbi:DNA binding protein [Phytophthora megakarya]|uniref:DNA binding protein n=1 Tax=Phytophthora megakarya TaxID=4795 RepID=A0A225VE53_9STRA|nr:DNA binding protein [Phytophthora megakarya]